MHDLESFVEALALYFGWAGAQPDSRLDELGLDSLEMYELVDLLSEAAPDPLPTDIVESLITLADVYGLYENYLSRQTGPRA